MSTKRSTGAPATKKTVSSAKAATKKASATPAKPVKKTVEKIAPRSGAVKKSAPAKPRRPAAAKTNLSSTTTKKSASVKKTASRSPAIPPVIDSADRRPYVSSLHPPHFDPGLDESLDPGFITSSEVMDETDYAQHLQLKEQAAISVRARELNRPEHHPDFDGETCVECGEDIPANRLLLNKVRCVDCQTFLEEADARKRRTVG